MAKGSDTSSNLFSGMILIGVLESIGSVRSPTVTERYLEPRSQGIDDGLCRDEIEQRYPRVGDDSYGPILLLFSWHVDPVPPLLTYCSSGRPVRTASITLRISSLVS